LVNISKDTTFICLYVQYIYSKKLFPEGREQFSFSYDNEMAILYGGFITNNNSNKIWKFNPSNYSWSILEYDCATAISRSGHTAILYQKKLYLFGGKSKNLNSYLFQEIEIFDLEYNTWISPNISCKNYLKLRKNHIAVLIGKKKN